MDPRRNPYAPGAGTAPPAVAGREREIDEFEVALDRLASGRPANPIILTGSRGTGKTVLLNEFESMAARSSWYTAFQEVGPNTQLPQLIAVLARRVLFAISGRERARERVRRALGVLRSFSAGAFGFQLQVDVEPVVGMADSGILELDLRDLMLELGEAAREAESGVLFGFDEVHTLGERDMDVLDQALHGLMQHRAPVTFVGAGLFPSYVHSEPDSFTRVSTYAGRLYRYIRLGPLDGTAASAALRNPAVAEGADFDEDALASAVAWAAGYPWYIQLLGAAAWEAAESSPIRLTDVGAAQEAVQAELDQSFFPRMLRSLGKGELKTLSAIASNGGESVPFGTVGRVLGAEPHAWTQLIDRLATRDLVVIEYTGAGERSRRGRSPTSWAEPGTGPDEYCVSLVVPRLGDFLVRRYPVQPLAAADVPG